MDFGKLWNDIVNFFTSSFVNIVIAIAVLIVGYVVIKLLMRFFRKLLERKNVEKISQTFILSLLKFVLYLALWMAVLATLGVNLSGVVALIAAAGLAIAMALKDSLSNLANGIIIITTKPFKVGDLININGVEGEVFAIGMWTTKLMTVDNKMVVLPNSTIMTNSLTNYDANPIRRIDIKLSVAYESDVDLVKKILFDIANSNDKILLEPEPFVSINEYSASSLDFIAKFWVESKDYWDMYYYLKDTIFNEFKRNNICIPFNQMEVRLREDQPQNIFRDEPLAIRKSNVKKRVKKYADFDEVRPLFDLDKYSSNEVQIKSYEKRKKNLQKEIDELDSQIEKTKIKIEKENDKLPKQMIEKSVYENANLVNEQSTSNLKQNIEELKQSKGKKDN